MAQVIYGLQRAGPLNKNATLTDGTIYAQHYGVLAANGRIIKIAGLLGAQNQPMNARLAAYIRNAAVGAPSQFIGAVSSFSLTNNWGSNNNGGTVYDRDVTSVTPGRGNSQAGILVRSGETIFIAIEGDEPLRVGREDLAGKERYLRTQVGLVFPDPFSHTSVSVVGDQYTLWATIEENRAPVIVSTGPSGVTGDLTPDFTFTFTDADRTAGYQDYPTKATVKVWENISGAYSFIGQYTATLAVPSAGTGSVTGTVTWAGPALTYGKTYVYTLDVEDEIGGSSGTGRDGYATGSITTPSGALTFSTSNVGILTSLTPTGKLLTLTPANITAKYEHPLGTFLDKVQVRLRKLTSTGAYATVFESGLIDITNVDPTGGPTVTLTWAAAGLPDLEWGSNYRVQWRAQDTSANLSDYNFGTPFTTDYAPQQAINIEPDNGVTVTNYPQASFYALDVDDVASALTPQFEITGPYTLSNPGFDTNITDWTYSEESASFIQTVSRDTTAPHSGAGNLRVVMAGSPSNLTNRFFLEHTNTANKFPCVPTYSYGASGWFKRAGTIAVGFIGLNFYSAADALLQTSVGPELTPTAGAWTQGFVSAVAPTNAAYFRVFGGGRTSVASSTFTVDYDDFIVNSGVRYIRTGVHAGGNIFIYQLTATDMATLGTYALRGRALDAVQNGPWSESGTFVYGTGATATLTAPTAAQVFTTQQPTITWTLTGGTQSGFRIIVRDAISDDSVYDSNWVMESGTRSFVVPQGYLGNATSYVVELWIDNGSIQALVDSEVFSVSFTAPAAPTGFTATPYKLDGDVENSGVYLSWDAIGDAPETLMALEIWIDEGTGRKRVAQFNHPGVTSFFYPFPKSGVDVEYLLRKVLRNPTREGLFAQAFARIDLTTITLVSVLSPTTRRVAMQAWNPTRETLSQFQEWAVPAGGTDYVEQPGQLRGQDFTVSARLFDRQDGTSITAEYLMAKLRDLFEGIRDPVTGRITADILCLRDPRGNKIFGRYLGNLTATHQKGGVRYDVEFGFRRLSYTEGA